MPEPPAIDRFQPSFFRYPIQNARTGYQPTALPLLLIQPFTRTLEGTPLSDAAVWDLTYLI